MLRIIQNEKGLTLLEVIISMGILGIVSMLFVTIMGSVSAINRDSYNRTRQSMSAASKLESWGGSSTEERLVLDFGGESWTVEGRYEQQIEGDVTYEVFVPN